MFDDFLIRHNAHLVESRVTYNDDGSATYEMSVRAPADVTMRELDNYLQSVTVVHSVDYMAVC